MNEELTIQIYFNINADHFDGYQPGHPLMRVFAYTTARDGRTVAELVEQAFRIGNSMPGSEHEQELSTAYYAEELRSISVGDVVVAGEAPLACDPAGWHAIDGQITVASTEQARQARESAGWCLPPTKERPHEGDETADGTEKER